MKILPVGAEFFHADGRTDMTKLKVAFRNFLNAPKNPAAVSSITLLELINILILSCLDTHDHCKLVEKPISLSAL